MYRGKTIQRVAGVPVENILRCYRLVEHLTVGDLAGVMQVAGIHGGGSPQMETIALIQRYPLQELKGVAKYLAGIDTDFVCFERNTVNPKQILNRFKQHK
ncbi:4-hydroxyphenylacetate 3-hydroxylase C-terminal domain-containing protein [Desulfoscipio geothermicus]|uniref:4-hydroxyphenylacetate 3-hydroxylase C-terminal domain-containing protein n=1 Tax=Desulfoscipio geothermicus TaxID=39060 RepID=UPI0031845961